MTLIELKNRIDEIFENSSNIERTGNTKVCVVINEGGMGGTPCEEITGAVNGFDWNSGKFMLFTDRKLTREPKQIDKLQCNKCKIMVDKTYILTSLPPKYKGVCDNCSKVYYLNENEI